MDKRNRWICTGLIALVSVLILAGMLLGYISIDLSSVVRDHLTFSGRLELLADILGSTQQKIEVSGMQMLRTLFGAGGSGLDADGHSLLRQLRLLVLIPYLAAAVTLGFCFARRLWGYIVTAAASAGGLLYTLLSTLVFLPARISSQLATAVSGTVSELAQQTPLPGAVTDLIASVAQEQTADKVTAAAIRSLTCRGLGPGWWITVIGLAVLFGSSLAGIWLCLQEMKRPRSVVGRMPRISFLDGEFAGSSIPLTGMEQIVIGRDPKLCNLIWEAPGIESMHCAISFDRERELYRVKGWGLLFVKDRPFDRSSCKPGTILRLGEGQSRIRLE